VHDSRNLVEVVLYSPKTAGGENCLLHTLSILRSYSGAVINTSHFTAF
jgi:hypothetical protein